MMANMQQKRQIIYADAECIVIILSPNLKHIIIITHFAMGKNHCKIYLGSVDQLA